MFREILITTFEDNLQRKLDKKGLKIIFRKNSISKV